MMDLISRVESQEEKTTQQFYVLVLHQDIVERLYFTGDGLTTEPMSKRIYHDHQFAHSAWARWYMDSMHLRRGFRGAVVRYGA